MRYLLLAMLLGPACVPAHSQFVQDAGPKSVQLADSKAAFRAAFQQVVLEGLTVKAQDEAAGVLQTDWSDMFVQNFGGGPGNSQYRLLVAVNDGAAVVTIQCQAKAAPSVAQAMLLSGREMESSLPYEPCPAEYATSRPRGWAELQNRVSKAMATGSIVPVVALPAAGDVE